MSKPFGIKISNFSRILFFIDVVVLLLIQVSQGAALNYYIIKQFKEYFTAYFLFMLDFLCLFIFIGTFVICYNHFTRRDNSDSVRRRHFNRFAQKFPPLVFGTLPLSYISWLFYILLLIGKILVIFYGEVTVTMFGNKEFGSKLLEVIIGLSCVVFLLLVEAHNWNKVNTECFTYVLTISKKTAIEIFDSIEMYSMMIEDKNIVGTTEGIIYLLASSNFLLPAISLYELSVADFGRSKPISTPRSIMVEIIHSAARLLLIDVPFLFVRLYIWLVYQGDTTMFMMKNLFYIIVAARELYMHIAHYNKIRKKPEENKKSETYTEIPLTDNVEQKEIEAS